MPRQLDKVKAAKYLASIFEDKAITFYEYLLRRNRAITALTFRLDLLQCDERDHIQSVVEQGDIEPHYIQANKISPLIDLEQILGHQDEAFYAPNLFLHHGLYNAARRQNVRVMLDGFDGDTTIFSQV
ncbi:MAG: asparagine synthase-related protein [Phormidesmis sp.]